MGKGSGQCVRGVLTLGEKEPDVNAIKSSINPQHKYKQILYRMISTDDNWAIQEAGEGIWEIQSWSMHIKNPDFYEQFYPVKDAINQAADNGGWGRMRVAKELIQALESTAYKTRSWRLEHYWKEINNGVNFERGKFGGKHQWMMSWPFQVGCLPSATTISQILPDQLKWAYGQYRIASTRKELFIRLEDLENAFNQNGYEGIHEILNAYNQKDK